MANPSIISTKINIPRYRADVVTRPRVMEILNEGPTRPSTLILVSASAGYGKRYFWFTNAILKDDLLYLFVEGDIGEATQIYLATHAGSMMP